MLDSFYAQHDPMKTSVAIAKIYRRCSELAQAIECQGSPAAELASMLRAKYGELALEGFQTRFSLPHRDEL